MLSDSFPLTAAETDSPVWIFKRNFNILCIWKGRGNRRNLEEPFKWPPFECFCVSPTFSATNNASMVFQNPRNVQFSFFCPKCTASSRSASWFLLILFVRFPCLEPLGLKGAQYPPFCMRPMWLHLSPFTCAWRSCAAVRSGATRTCRLGHPGVLSQASMQALPVYAALHRLPAAHSSAVWPLFFPSHFHPTLLLRNNPPPCRPIWRQVACVDLASLVTFWSSGERGELGRIPPTVEISSFQCPRGAPFRCSQPITFTHISLAKASYLAEPSYSWGGLYPPRGWEDRKWIFAQ